MTTMSRRLPVLVEDSIREASVARLHAAFAYEQKARTDATITCRKGCSNCCYHPVLISVLEGIEIYRSLVAKGKWPQLREAFLEHQDATWGLSLEVWLLSMRPCPLLKENQCSAYESRPLSCRVTLSQADPYYCHPHQLDGGSGMLSKKDVLEATASIEAELLRKHSLRFGRLPLSAAVLLAERIEKGELLLEESLTYLAEQTIKQHLE